MPAVLEAGRNDPDHASGRAALVQQASARHRHSRRDPQEGGVNVLVWDEASVILDVEAAVSRLALAEYLAAMGEERGS